MRRIARRLWNFLSGPGDRRPDSSTARGKASVRLELWPLEERVLPSASTLGTVSGMVFVASGVQQTPAPGVAVTLTGTSDQGDNISLSATTDSQGDFAFRSVEAGAYQLAAASGSLFVQGGSSEVSVVGGRNTAQDMGIGGLAADVISGRVLLSSATSADLPFLPAGATANSAPVAATPIANVTVASGSTKTVDVAAAFSDPDTTNSTVRFDTSDGPMTVTLFDSQAPQTTANFLDYVLNSRYDDTIFHRLDTNPPVLQGGGFGVQSNPSGGVSFPTVANSGDPNLANEFSAAQPDALGTLAMAKLGGDPNSATSEFFFNLADNSTTLGSSNNGGFAVFGQVASDATSQAVFQALQSTPVQNESAFNSAFGTLPIGSSANLTNFPTNTTPSNYLTINDVQLVKHDESLTYTVASISDPSLVSAGFDPLHPEVLSLQPLGPSGTATITVQATDEFGLSVQTSFQVTVVGLTVGSVTNPINAANAASTTASGTADPGASISVTASDGTNTSTAVTTTAGTNGAWTASGIKVSSLIDGTITYTATTTDAAGDTVTASKTSTKNTIAPSVAIISAPSVNAATEASTTVSGTATAGASISVTASDGATPPVTVTVQTSATDGTWTANLNVSSLADGTITYTAVATTAGNTATSAPKTATKDTAPPAISIVPVTIPITAANEADVTVSGMTEVGATVQVTATDKNGKTTTAVPAIVAPGTGSWAASNIDVSGLADGLITFTATAADAAGNTDMATTQATKSTGP